MTGKKKFSTNVLDGGKIVNTVLVNHCTKFTVNTMGDTNIKRDRIHCDSMSKLKHDVFCIDPLGVDRYI